MKARGVFFDLYGTLLLYGDVKSAWAAWLRRLHTHLQAHGLTLSLDELAKACDGFFAHAAPPDRGEGLTMFERRIAALCIDLKLCLTPTDIRTIADSIADAWHEYVTVDPEARLVLETLGASRPLALVSNFDHPRYVRTLLAKHGLDRFFQSIVISGEAGASKPDPAIFQLALAETGLTASDVIHVGDTIEDTDGAIAAGITPVLLERPEGATKRSALDYRSEHQIEPDGSGHSEDVVRIRALNELLSLVP
jgi:HAD superfamily hydrolase (TIGR01509 family)